MTKHRYSTGRAVLEGSQHGNRHRKPRRSRQRFFFSNPNLMHQPFPSSREDPQYTTASHTMLVNTLLTLTLAIASSAFALPGGGLQRIIKRADVTTTSDVNISGPSISLPVSLTSSTDGLSTDYASPSATTVISGAGPMPTSIPSNGTGNELSQAADLLAQYLDQSVAAGSE